MNHAPPDREPALLTFARIVRLLAIVVWVGGLIFFAFILAPAAFRVLPTTHWAGTIVAATLAPLNHIGYVCGTAFVLATAYIWRRASAPSRKLLGCEIIAVLLMLASTAIVQANIVPAMERDRIAAGGDIDAAPADNPARLDFERLHPLSEKVEGAALLLGLGLVVLMGLEGRTQTAQPAAPTR